MKRIIYSIAILIFISLILNYIWVTKYAAINEEDLPGIYVYANDRFSDTLILYPNHNTSHIFHDFTNGDIKSKKGQWGVSNPGIIIIQNYSFAIANYPVDFHYYLDFLYRVRIDFNLTDTYTKRKD